MAEVPTSLRRKVCRRAGNRCEYCQSQERFATHAFSVEHIVPKSRGGRTRLDNLALACQGCNNHKYTRIQARDPVTGRQADLFHPRRHSWSEHFTWDADFARVLGLTPIGRATSVALALNRPGLLNLRRVLYQAGAHPPAGSHPT